MVDSRLPSQRVRGGEPEGVRKHLRSKKVHLCFKKAFRRKKRLLRNLRKPSEPSPLLCSPPLRVFDSKLSWVMKCLRATTALSPMLSTIIFTSAPACMKVQPSVRICAICLGNKNLATKILLHQVAGGTELLGTTMAPGLSTVTTHLSSKHI